MPSHRALDPEMTPASYLLAFKFGENIYIRGCAVNLTLTVLKITVLCRWFSCSKRIVLALTGIGSIGRQFGFGVGLVRKKKLCKKRIGRMMLPWVEIGMLSDSKERVEVTVLDVNEGVIKGISLISYCIWSQCVFFFGCENTFMSVSEQTEPLLSIPQFMMATADIELSMFSDSSDLEKLCWSGII